MILSMQTIAAMKKELNENFGVYLHVRDACAGQSFWFDDQPEDQVIDWIRSRAKKLGGKASFFDGGKQFTIV